LNFVDPAKAHPVGDFRRKTEIVRTRFPEQKGRDAALRMTTSLYARWKPGRGQARFCAREKDAGLKPGATLKAKRKSRFLVAMLLRMTTKTNERESPRAPQQRRAPWATQRQDPPFRKVRHPKKPVGASGQAGQEGWAREKAKQIARRYAPRDDSV
jgi:hypothetical protein